MTSAILSLSLSLSYIHTYIHNFLSIFLPLLRVQNIIITAGDEELPYNFTSGANLVPNWGERLQALHGSFTAQYMRVNSDMQQKFGYPPPESEEEVLKYMNVATNQVSNRFNCLGVTLEMPFKDCRSNPDPERGWTPARSRKLGESLIEVLDYMQPYLRAEGEFWKALPTDDAYVPTTDDIPGSVHGPDEGVFQMLKKRFYSDVHEVRKPSSPRPVKSVIGTSTGIGRK